MPSQTRRNAPVPSFGSASSTRPAIVSPSSHCIRSISNGLIRTVCGGKGQFLLCAAFALTMASKFLASALTRVNCTLGTVLATASAIAVAALAPVSVSASAGPVTATMTAVGAASDTIITGATGMRITVARGGGIAFNGGLRPCRFGCEPERPDRGALLRAEPRGPRRRRRGRGARRPLRRLHAVLHARDGDPPARPGDRRVRRDRPPLGRELPRRRPRRRPPRRARERRPALLPALRAARGGLPAADEDPPAPRPAPRRRHEARTGA